MLANKAKWRSWAKKLRRQVEWFAPRIDIEFDLRHTQFEDIPWVEYSSVPGSYGIEPRWYDDHVTAQATGFDVVLLVLTKKQWKEPGKARGWRTDNSSGVVQLHLGCDEHEKMAWPNMPVDDVFFQVCRHELMHALFMICNQPDTTHYWWDRGQLEQALAELNFGVREQKIQILTKLIAITKSLLSLVMKNSNPLLLWSEQKVGFDASPLDRAPDELGCAESVSTGLREVYGDFPIVTGTYTIWEKLREHPLFTVQSRWEPGDIILSPTGSSKSSIPGHVGVIGHGGVVYSNNSNTGKWDTHFTVDSWIEYYQAKGGLPVFYYRRNA